MRHQCSPRAGMPDCSVGESFDPSPSTRTPPPRSPWTRALAKTVTWASAQASASASHAYPTAIAPQKAPVDDDGDLRPQSVRLPGGGHRQPDRRPARSPRHGPACPARNTCSIMSPSRNPEASAPGASLVLGRTACCQGTRHAAVGLEADRPDRGRRPGTWLSSSVTRASTCSDALPVVDQLGDPTKRLGLLGREPLHASVCDSMFEIRRRHGQSGELRDRSSLPGGRVAGASRTLDHHRARDLVRRRKTAS